MTSHTPNTSSSPSSRLDDAALEEILRQVRGIHRPRGGSPPSRPYRGLPKPTPGPYPKNHGGPIRIVRLNDGTLTEYGKKLEQERLARLTASNEEGEMKDKDSAKVEEVGEGNSIADGAEERTRKDAAS